MIPKKIKKIYLNDVDENGSDIKNREYIDISQVWHDASEKPLLEETEIIFINERGFAHISERNGGAFSYTLVDYDWEGYVNTLRIKKWAYVSDLLPKGGQK